MDRAGEEIFSSVFRLGLPWTSVPSRDLLCPEFADTRRARLHLDQERHSDSLNVYHSKNAVVGFWGTISDFDGGVILHPDLVCDEHNKKSILRRLESEHEPLGRFVRGDRETRKLGETPIFSICRPGMKVWGHWILDVLPSLDMFVKAIAEAKLPKLDYKYLLPYGMPENCLKSLSVLFGIEKSNCEFFREDKEIVHSENFWVASSFRNDTAMSPETNDFVSRACEKIIALEPGDNQNIYVSRRGFTSWSGRIVENEEALEQIALQNNFRVISPERMTFSEQISAFARASIIIGPQGSGLHNTLFSPKGALVCELNVPSTGGLQSGICALREQQIAFILPEHEEKVSNRHSLTYSTDKFHTALDALKKLSGQ